MQQMPDKDFDKLFRDKFIDAEIEPSANLWAKIEVQLEPKRKRIFPIYWMAAATIAVAFTAMLVFQKPEKIQLHGTTEMANADVATENVSTENFDEAISTSTVKQKYAYQENIRAAKQSVTAVSNEGKTLANEKNIHQAMQPEETIARLPIKQADPKPIDLSPITPVESPIVMAQVGSSEVNDDMDNNNERKGIRNVGDLVNYVVDKVDKRDRKLLRFNTDDDDNSSLIGINIGFLQLNKRNNNK